jgi:hypothetical protein
MLIPDEYGHGTSSILKDISLSFQGVQEHPNWMSYATWASVIIWTAPRQVGLSILKLFRKFWLNHIYLDVGPVPLESLSRPLSMHM